MHDKCPFITCSLTLGRLDTILRKCPVSLQRPWRIRLTAVSLENTSHCSVPGRQVLLYVYSYAVCVYVMSVTITIIWRVRMVRGPTSPYYPCMSDGVVRSPTSPYYPCMSDGVVRGPTSPYYKPVYVTRRGPVSHFPLLPVYVRRRGPGTYFPLLSVYSRSTFVNIFYISSDCVPHMYSVVY